MAVARALRVCSAQSARGRLRAALPALVRTALLPAVLLAGACAEPQGRVAVGERVPQFAAPTLTGEQLGLRELRGEVVLLNVWATWCYPCRREMPGLEALHRELGDAGLRVVAVSVDAAGAAGDIREFLDELDLTMLVLHDSRADVSRAFSTIGVPETFLIGSDGTLVRHWIGRIDAHSESVRRPILDALAERQRRSS